MNTVNMYRLRDRPSCSDSDNKSTCRPTADEYDSMDSSGDGSSKRRMRGGVKKREAGQKKSVPLQKPKEKKSRGRVKIDIEFIKDMVKRRHTFSKRRINMMKKVKELSMLTGTQVLLLVASETGRVYEFASDKFQPMITGEAGKALIQSCLNTQLRPPRRRRGCPRDNDDEDLPTDVSFCPRDDVDEDAYWSACPGCPDEDEPTDMSTCPRDDEMMYNMSEWAQACSHFDHFNEELMEFALSICAAD